jgi:hypothetical protein
MIELKAAHVIQRSHVYSGTTCRVGAIPVFFTAPFHWSGHIMVQAHVGPDFMDRTGIVDKKWAADSLFVILTQRFE